LSAGPRLPVIQYRRAARLLQTTRINIIQDQYYVVVSDAYGQAVSQNATLAVNQGVQIQTVDQPTNSYVNAGAPASFSLVATSTVPLSYQWYMVPSGESAAQRNITTWTGSLTSTATTASAVLIEGANSATHTVPAASLSQNGAVYFVIVSNGGLTSSVTSNAGPLFVGPPTNIPVCSSNWIKQGTDVSFDASSCSYTLTTAGTSEFGEIIWPNLISTGNVKLSFTIATSNTSSTPADGFAMVLGDPSLGGTLQSAGEAGEGLGARGIPDFVLAFDDFYNAACTGSCFPAPYPADPSSSSNPDYLGVGRGEDVLWENPYFNVNSSIPFDCAKRRNHIARLRCSGLQELPVRWFGRWWRTCCCYLLVARYGEAKRTRPVTLPAPSARMHRKTSVNRLQKLLPWNLAAVLPAHLAPA
jgi:hypothetical protein